MAQESFTTLEHLGREGLIERIKQLGLDHHERILHGIGDDAAVICGEANQNQVYSTETFTEGVDFDLTFMPIHHLGAKVVMAACSDICAMNAAPKWIMVNLALPNRISLEFMDALYQGIAQACKDLNIYLIGGDLTGSHHAFGITVTAIGEVQPEQVVTRSGAKKDDAICVTGDLGGALAGLKILLREKKHWETSGEEVMKPDLSDYEYVVQRQLLPVCRYDIIKAFHENEIYPTAMIDLNQGLIKELIAMMKASDAAAYIYEAALPVSPLTREVANELQENVDQFSLYGGEDYELMFTLPEESVERFAKLFKDFVVIGKLIDDKPGSVTMQTAEGEQLAFNHPDEGGDTASPSDINGNSNK